MAILVLWPACSGKEASGENPDGLFAEAEEYFKDGNYREAIEKFRDVKNRFPYSAKATEAELRIADAYYEQESYIEAVSAYEVFLELHPTHTKGGYVQYRIAMSYYQQIPSNTARDLSAAHRAIDSFQKLIERYPSSEYVAKAKEQMVDAKKKLAEHEDYVGNFYFQREHYLSAAFRYEALLKEYSDLGYDERALYRIGECDYHMRRFGKAREALTKLLSKYPDSEYKASAQALLGQMTNSK